MSTHCYFNQVEMMTWMPCGPVNETHPVVPCCNAGDYCMTNGICHYTHSLKGGSGYYTGGCTDPSYDNPECTTRCGTDGTLPDVVWLDDKTNPSQWACCEATGVTPTPTLDCKHPSDDTIEIVPQASLKALFFVPPGGFVYTSEAAETSAETSSASGSRHASVAATGVGIGIGATIGFLLLVVAPLSAGAVLLWKRVKQRRQRPPSSYVNTEEGVQKGDSRPIKQHVVSQSLLDRVGGQENEQLSEVVMVDEGYELPERMGLGELGDERRLEPRELPSSRDHA